MTQYPAISSLDSGQPAFRVHTVLPDGGTLSWEPVSGSAIVRYEEQDLSESGSVIDGKQYTPSILVLDESAAHLMAAPGAKISFAVARA